MRPGYQGTAGGLRDPATPGPYCLLVCRCGTCPQYRGQQIQLSVLREQEYQQRIRTEGERAARREQAIKHRGAA